MKVASRSWQVNREGRKGEKEREGGRNLRTLPPTIKIGHSVNNPTFAFLYTCWPHDCERWVVPVRARPERGSDR